MTVPRVYKTEAIVIKRTNLGEADKILTLYTPYLGKIRAIAKGVRRPKSRLGGNVELLTHARIMLARGRELDIITQGEAIDSFLPLRGDLRRLSLALYAAELVERFTIERLENYSIYRLLLDTLSRISEAPNELAIRYFELHLLDHLGYRPQLYRCLICGSPLEPKTNFFSPASGGVLCPGCRSSDALAHPITINALKMMRLLQDGDYQLAQRVRISPELSSELELLMRDYIQYILEREVKSARFVDRIRKEELSETREP